MPIYEYACPHCRKTFEEWFRNGGAAEHPCPDCGRSARRFISNTSFVLKGGGWYVTEYGNQKDADKNDTSTGSPPPAPEAKTPDATASGPPAAKDDAAAPAKAASGEKAVPVPDAPAKPRADKGSKPATGVAV